MRKRLLTVAGVAVALASVLVVTVYAIQRPERTQTGTSALLEPSSIQPDSAETRVQATYAIVAEAIVATVHHAALSMAAGGIVSEVLLQEGEIVEEGQTILRLEDAHQRAAVARAEAALDSARAGFAILLAGPRTEEISATQASLDAAQARLARLKEGSRPAELAAARASLDAAQATLQRLFDDPEDLMPILPEGIPTDEALPSPG